MNPTASWHVRHEVDAIVARLEENSPPPISS
jgi:hypothetical protein